MFLTRILSCFRLGISYYLRAYLAEIIELLIRKMKKLSPFVFVYLRVVTVRFLAISFQPNECQYQDYLTLSCTYQRCHL